MLTKVSLREIKTATEDGGCEESSWKKKSNKITTPHRTRAGLKWFIYTFQFLAKA